MILCLCGNLQAASTIYTEIQRMKNRQIFMEKKQGKTTYFVIYEDTLQSCGTKAVWHCLKMSKYNRPK